MRRRWFPVVLAALVVGNVAFATTSAWAGGSCSMGPFSDRHETEIKVTRDCFEPTVARIEVGDTVTFFNGEGATLHMVGGMAGSFGDLHTELAPGKRLSYRFDEEGVYPYACILHPGMGGVIVVGDGEGDATAAGAVEVDTSSSERADARPEPTALSGSDRSGLLPVLAVLGLAGLWFLVRNRGGAGREVVDPN